MARPLKKPRVVREVSKAQFNKWIKSASLKQVRFLNTYLKTLNYHQAYLASGYNFTRSDGAFRCYIRLLPYILYKIKQTTPKINKEFIIQKWLKLIEKGDKREQIDALKELSKLLNMVQTSAQVNLNVKSSPVVIKFSEDSEEQE